MKPSLGRTIIVVAPQAANNGTDRAPGVITRVWSPSDVDTMDSPAMVNATVFPDASIPQSVTSLSLYEDEQTAREDAPPGMPFAYWPPRS